MKSENYRLLRKKSLYITSIIGLTLITAAAIILYLSGEFEQNFPYATSLFFYMNVIDSKVLILIVAFLFNMLLTGKDMFLTKHAVSFGVSRNMIFWTKLFLTLSYFLFLCLIGLLLMIGLGENLLESEEQSIRNFLTASFNMLPIVLSGFFLIHMLKILRVGDVYIIVILLFFFVFSGDLLRMLLRPISALEEMYRYAPSALLSENSIKFMNLQAQFDYHYCVVGVVISVVSLLIGAKIFARQNID